MPCDAHRPSSSSFVSRRQMLRQGLSAAAVTALAPAVVDAADRTSKHTSKRSVVNGRIKQSIVFWCFNVAGEKWSIERTSHVAKQLGCRSVELVNPADWKVLKKHGLVCAIAPNGMPGAPFKRGFNNPRYHKEVIARTTEMIDACADAGFPNVIAFTGYKWHEATNPNSGEISPEEGADNCVKALKIVVRHAEKKGVTVCLEHLNSRDHSHPMKGHPGYQGDDIDYVAKIIRRVDSPRMKLLFDIYHVQVMNGDLIRRIEQNKDIIGHVHTAGNPGRGELDGTQEIHYPPVMQKLIQIGYTGYVGQEFIPTRDPQAGLEQAVSLCDV